MGIYKSIRFMGYLCRYVLKCKILQILEIVSIYVGVACVACRFVVMGRVWLCRGICNGHFVIIVVQLYYQCIDYVITCTNLMI